MLTNNFFTSNWEFMQSELDLKSKFQMINIAILLSSIGLIFGMVSNYYRDVFWLIPIESILLCINSLLFILLRFKRDTFNIVSLIETVQFTFLFIFLVYTNEPSSLKHIWIFTYPVILLYFQKEKSAIYWVIFMVAMLLLVPLQPFVEVSYSIFQVSYISFVLIIISIIIYFYQKKIDEARAVILSQQTELTQKVEELMQKDKLLNIQSKQAVMGEMMSMIAHQWRQPLSTVTLSISNLQVKKLLGSAVEEEKLYKTLEDISDTVVYLSDTIDDFQTYFKPNKELDEVSIDFVLNKAINFTQARLTGTSIEISILSSFDETICTYPSELIQVILNILNNAIDELLKLEIKEPKIIINIVDEIEYFELSIRDNAHGVQAEEINKIFEPYFSTKGKNGTGLGLYMSQMIMQKQFNSKIEVESSPQGAKFILIIPKKLS